MTWVRRLGVLAWIAAEIAIFVLLVRWVGWLWVIALLALGVGMGIGLFGAATRALVPGDLAAAPAGPFGPAPATPPSAEARSRAGRYFTAAVLWLFPGFLSDIPALLLTLPVIGPALGRRFRMWGGRWMEKRGYSTTLITEQTSASGHASTPGSGDVITGEVISRSDDPISESADPRRPGPGEGTS